MSQRKPELAVGQLRSQVRLGTQALYRVRDWDEHGVRMEVVSAPGLAAGAVFMFTKGAVRDMDVVTDSPPEF